MKEYVSPSRKVIKYHRSHLLESENRKHFPLYKQRAPQRAETLPAYPPGPRLLSGRAIRNTFLTPSPCTRLGHPALRNAWTRVLFKFTNTFQGYLWTVIRRAVIFANWIGRRWKNFTHKFHNLRQHWAIWLSLWSTELPLGHVSRGRKIRIVFSWTQHPSFPPTLQLSG